MHAAATSSADESDIELYTCGSCHAFAIALHRELGWGIVAITDPGNPYWEDPEDPDNQLDSVSHVYAVSPDGTLWDVLGARHPDAAEAELAERHPDLTAFGWDECGGEAGLAAYVDEADGPGDRPLHSLSRCDIDEAWACATRVLRDVPGFPQAPAP